MEMLKGPDIAVRALADAVARGADARLTFAGFNMASTQSPLLQLAAELRVTDRINWAGTPELSELVDLYRNHDVFLFPSRIIEGLGVVNCEALACGLPVIGTAHSGSAEVILDGQSGFRVPRDDSEAMGTHLSELYANRNLLERFSAQALVIARRFAPKTVLNMLETELIRIVEAR